jgi:adenylate kinase family enzyme
MVSILLFSGFSRSGKDTIAKILIQKYNYRRFALADILKEICSNKTGIPIYHFHIDSLKDNKDENCKSPRDYCIEEGNKLAIEDPNYLCKLLKKKIINYLQHDNNKNIVITDIRRKVEQNYFIKNFPNQTYTVYIYRFDKPLFDNELETEITKNDCKYLINNLF